MVEPGAGGREGPKSESEVLELEGEGLWGGSSERGAGGADGPIGRRGCA